MIRITNVKQAIGLRGTIPELAVIRSQQFMGKEYLKEVHGLIIVLQGEPDLSAIPELGMTGLHDPDGCPDYEFVEVFIEGGRRVYEIVFQIDADKTIAVIAVDGPWLDAGFRDQLREACAGCTPIAL